MTIRNKILAALTAFALLASSAWTQHRVDPSQRVALDKSKLRPEQAPPDPGIQQRLFVVNLPAGDVTGLDIDYSAGTGRTKYQSRQWLSVDADQDGKPDYDGVVFRGAGIDRTHLRPKGDCAALIDRHDGVVRFESMTVHCGPRQGIWFGLEHKGAPVKPKFQLQLKYVHVLADPPNGGSRHSTFWPLFGYQSDCWLEDVTIDAKYATEHASYWHGFAKEGIRWNRVHVTGAGSQICKVRSDRTETDPVLGTSVWITNSVLDDWYWPWSNRGGGGIVMEGASCNLFVTGSLFRAGGPVPSPGAPFPALAASDRTRAIMVDNAGGDFYNVLDGKPGVGFAAGHIVIKNCGFSAGPGVQWLSILMRVGNNGGPGYAARSVSITGCGAYGQNIQFQLSNMPAAKLVDGQRLGGIQISGNNTAAIAEYARSLGIDTTHEAVLPLSNRVAKLSEGLIR